LLCLPYGGVILKRNGEIITAIAIQIIARY